jgi:hypothetical protein
MKIINKYSFLALAAAGMLSCTKLDEKLNSQLTEAEFNSLSGGSGSTDVSALLRGVYLSMLDPYANQAATGTMAEPGVLCIRTNGMPTTHTLPIPTVTCCELPFLQQTCCGLTHQHKLEPRQDS